MLRRKWDGWIGLGVLVCFACLSRAGAGVVDPFPVSVDADQGSGWFGAGDQIVVTEVRGSSHQLAPGQTYQVRGKYRLLSHPQGVITAYFGGPDGKTTIVDPAQTTTVSQGNGQFTLMLPAGKGQPRISMTAADSSQQLLGQMCLVAAMFPYKAQFHDGGAKLGAGDDIAISEIRATSSSSNGNVPVLLQIRGTYHLSSLPLARLTIDTQRGAGKFSLVIPAPTDANVQLAFFPPGGRAQPVGAVSATLTKIELGPSTMSPVYSLADAAPNNIFNLNLSQALVMNGGADMSWVNPQEPRPPTAFPYTVQFQLGYFSFEPGDDIKVTKILGTASTFQVGQWYQIQGVYRLSTSPQAMLAANITAGAITKKVGDGTVWPFQAEIVGRGSANFSLILMYNEYGYPHVAYYPAGGGSDFGTRYFGTGDTVLNPGDNAAPADELRTNTGIALVNMQTSAASPMRKSH
jgi:hypothetical protein